MRPCLEHAAVVVPVQEHGVPPIAPDDVIGHAPAAPHPQPALVVETDIAVLNLGVPLAADQHPEALA